MSNQGTIRLKVTNSAPAIEKLWNGRFRLEFLCDNNSPKEDWYYDNISSILPDYGILQDTNFGSGVSEDWEAIPGSVYPDMRLVETEYVFIPSIGDKRVKLTYETLTAFWVEEKTEDTDYELNGLKRVSRTFVALPATAYDKVVGTSTIDSNGTTLYLGSLKIEKTDAKWSLTEMWLEAGTLSETLDSVGSQKAKIIETIGSDPSTPSGYVLASKQEGDFEGFQTNRFTFLKSDVELSRSEDKVGSQLSIAIEQFNGTPVTPAGYSLANTKDSDIEGIPTKRYTFLKDDTLLSETEDYVGSQLAIVQERFNPLAEPTIAEYVIANVRVSDYGGIPTKQYTFLKENVELSRSEDKVGSQLAITTEVFKPASAPTESGYSVASIQISDVDGIPTKRYTFLKDNVELSRSEDKVGSQLGIITEVFNPTTEPTEVGYSLASTQVSDVGGIPTKRYTFLKNNSILNTSTNSISDGVVEVSTTFFGTEGTTVGPVISRTTGDVEGIPTITVKTLQDNSGQSISGAGIISEFQQYVDFTYPGEVSIATDTDTVDGPVGEQPNYIFKSYWYSLKPPVTRKVLANVSISFQANGNLGITSPLWSPDGWAKGRVDGLGTNFAITTVQQTAQDKAFNQYTVVSGGDNSYSGTAGFGDTTGMILVEGTIILPLAAWSIEVSGGPGRPDGNTYTIDAKLTPAFAGADGTQYWKKTLVVATIPTR